MALCGPSYSGTMPGSAVEISQGLTLFEAYDLSLKRSEEIATKQELINEAQGHFYRALGSILPKASFVMTHFEQEVDSGGGEFGGENATSNAVRRTTPQKKFVFSQPLFQGFREFAAIQGAGAEKGQRSYEKQRAEELLFMDVVNAFYGLIQANKGTGIAESIRKALDERVKELEGRVKLGRSRDSELQTAIADLKVVEYELRIARKIEAISKELLEFYIGQKIEERLVDDAVSEEALFDIDQYLERSLNRSDYLAAEKAQLFAEQNVVVAQSGLFPTARLDGNYYTQRVGFQSGIDWDLFLTIDVPLFKGETFGAIKEAWAQRQIAELNTERTGREIRLDIGEAYEELKSSRDGEKLLFEAAEASKKSYELQVQEYRLNLVNNLDVLDALRQYENVERAYNQAHYESKKNYWKFKVAIGEKIKGSAK